MNKFNSRKLIFCSIWQIVFTALLVNGDIQAADYSSLTMWALGGYVAGNVGEHLAKRNGP